MTIKPEDILRDLMSALQISRLYPAWHPQFKKAVSKAFLTLRDALEQDGDFAIGIVDEELACGKEVFFELSKMERPMILYLKAKGINKMQFLKGLEEEELGKFFGLLTTPNEEMKLEIKDYLTISGIKNIIAGKLQASAESQEEFGTHNYLRQYGESLSKVTDTVNSLLDNDEIDALALKLNVSVMIESLIGRHQEFLNFGTLKRYDSRTYFHTMNVAILSMYFCSKLGFKREDVLNIGIAALFHDIGKIYISRKIIQKPSKLSNEEFEKIKSHVTKGTEILLKHVDELGILPVIICFEHHLKYDLTGYPKVTFPNKPYIASQIVSICDVYDALSQRRSYKNDYPPEMIYNIMIKEKGTSFEQRLIDKFFSVIGVWPIGTLVVLSDGRVAVVREENEEDIVSPKVEIIPPKEQSEIIDLMMCKQALNISSFLNPLNEGKKYLSFI
jgi:putative nucleotidyltransferase with HDIG domain